MDRRWTVAVMVAMVLAGAAPAQDGVREEELGAAPSGKPFMELLSSDGLHYAWMNIKGRTEMSVVFDGREGPVFRTLVKEWKFSADGQHFAYGGARDAGQYLVVDGVEVGPYESYRLGSLVFLAGGGTAYTIKRGDKRHLMANGQESPPYDEIGAPVVSPDGSRIAYDACTGEWKTGTHQVVLDGQPGPAFNSVFNLTFSADSRHFAYGARRGEQRVVVVDGQEQGSYEGLGSGSPVLSADGAHVAWLAKQGGKWGAVVDGQAQDFTWDTVGKDTAFIADGSRFVYETCQGDWKTGQHFVIVGDQRYGPYLGVWPYVFAPVGSRLAFKAKHDDKMWLNVDGQEWGPYDGTAKTSPVFSPDGRHVACHVSIGPWDGGAHYVIADSAPQGPYSSVWELYYSPDSQHLAYVVRKDDKTSVVRDGAVVSTSDAGATNVVFSPDSQRMAYHTVAGEWKGGKHAVVVDGVAGEEYDWVGGMCFSPDSKHMAYVAWRDKKYTAVVDGKVGGWYARILGDSVRFVNETTLQFLALRDDKLLRVTQEVAGP
ncbi:MAG: hypothetical protein KKI08_14560 [Armatimonadetes bacterium]|nr:hypothetical protein [Armatimonadota bacterium]